MVCVGEKERVCECVWNEKGVTEPIGLPSDIHVRCLRTAKPYA